MKTDKINIDKLYNPHTFENFEIEFSQKKVWAGVEKNLKIKNFYKFSISSFNIFYLSVIFILISGVFVFLINSEKFDTKQKTPSFRLNETFIKLNLFSHQNQNNQSEKNKNVDLNFRNNLIGSELKTDTVYETVYEKIIQYDTVYDKFIEYDTVKHTIYENDTVFIKHYINDTLKR